MITISKDKINRAMFLAGEEKEFNKTTFGIGCLSALGIRECEICAGSRTVEIDNHWVKCPGCNGTGIYGCTEEE